MVPRSNLLIKKWLKISRLCPFKFTELYQFINISMVWGVGSCYWSSQIAPLFQLVCTESTWEEGGEKGGSIGSKTRVYPRFQNLSFCDVIKRPTTTFLCSRMTHFIYIEKNGGRLKYYPRFSLFPHETLKNLISAQLLYSVTAAHFSKVTMYTKLVYSTASFYPWRNIWSGPGG